MKRTRIKIDGGTIGSLKEILKQLPNDTKVYFNGSEIGYAHMDAADNSLSFDDDPLDNLYEEEE